MAKLYYFDSPGRAEVIRNAFALTGQRFEDIRFNHEEWAEKYKPLSPSGQCPFLILEDGSILTESLAILFYVGKKGDIVPKDGKDIAKIIEVAMRLENMWGIMRQVYYSSDNDADRAAKAKELNGSVVEVFKVVEKLASATMSLNGYLVDDEMSIGDLIIHQAVKAVHVDKILGLHVEGEEIPNLSRCYKLVAEYLEKVHR